MLQLTTAANLPQLSAEFGWQLFEGGLKLMFVGGFFLYVIFSIMVIRQIKLMTHTISSPTDGALSAASWLYFAASIAVLLLAVFTL